MGRYKVLRNRKRVGEEFLAPQFNPSVQAVELSKFPLLPSIALDPLRYSSPAILDPG